VVEGVVVVKEFVERTKRYLNQPQHRYPDRARPPFPRRSLVALIEGLPTMNS